MRQDAGALGLADNDDARLDRVAVDSAAGSAVLLASARDVLDGMKPRLRAMLGADDYLAWIEPVAVAEACEKWVVLAVANDLARTRLQTDYLHRVQSVWASQDPKARSLKVVVRKMPPRQQAAEPAPAPPSADIVSVRPVRRTFETFVGGESNQMALALALEVASGPGHGSEIILFHGPTGVGKTHLMEAIAHHASLSGAGRESRRVLLLTAQQFLNTFQSALRERDTSPFKAALRSCDLLLIDDLHLICGKSVTLDEFFQTVGDLLAAGKTVMCTAEAGPEALVGISDRMRDVLNGGFAVRIGPPDLDLRARIAATKAREMAETQRPGAVAFALPVGACDVIAAKMSGSGRAVEGAVKKIFAASALIGREATMDVVLEVLGDAWRPSERAVTVDIIKRRVSAHFDISLEDLCSPSRHRSVARPRQIAMYFCKKLTRRSFPDIGGRFGGRDHTTVMHAVRRIDSLAAADPVFAAELQQIGRKITA